MRSIPIGEAKSQLSRIVEQASSVHERFEITRNGLPGAVLLGAGDYAALLETVAILSESKVVEVLDRGIKELGNGEVFTAEQVRAEMRKTAQ